MFIVSEKPRSGGHLSFNGSHLRLKTMDEYQIGLGSECYAEKKYSRCQQHPVEDEVQQLTILYVKLFLASKSSNLYDHFV